MSPWVLPATLSLIILIGATVVLLRSPPPNRLLVPLLLALGVGYSHTIGDSLVQLATTTEATWSALIVEYPAVLLIGPTWWLLAVRFTQVHGHPLSQHAFIEWGLFAVAAVFGIAFITNPWHGQFLTVQLGGRSEFHWIWWLHSVFMIGPICASAVVYVRLRNRVRNVVTRKRINLMLIAFVANMSVFPLYHLASSPSIDPNVLGVSVALMLFIGGVYRTRLYAISPEAVNTILRNESDGTLLLDIDGTLIYSNPAAESLIGSPLQIDSDVYPVLARVLSDPKTSVAPLDPADLRDRLSHPGQHTSEHLFRMGDDPLQWVGIQSSAVSNRRGDVVGRRLRLRDQSAYQEATREVAEQAAVLEAILGATDDGVLVTGGAENQEYLYYNDNFLNLCKLDSKQLGRDALQHRLNSTVSSTLDLEENLNAIRRDADHAYNFEINLVDDRIVSVRTHPLLRDGSVNGRVTRIRDVTDDRMAAAELRRRSEEVQLLLESTRGGIYGLDLEGRCTFCNSAGARLLGYDDPSDLLGRIMHEEIQHRAADGRPLPRDGDPTDRQLERGGLQDDREEVLWRADGSSFSAELRSSPTMRNGEVVGSVVSFEDITERKEAEAALLHRQKLESLGVIAGGIAHDFNNLLLSVLGNAQLAQEDLEPGSRALSHLRDIERIARRAGNLTGQLLSYAGKKPTQMESHELATLLHEVHELLDVSIPKTVSLRYEIAEALPSIFCDGSQILQVIMNLMINASEAIGAGGGSIVLSTFRSDATGKRCAPDRDRAARQADSYVALQVRDDGCGMLDEVRERIFDPFFTTKTTGRGLGLAAALGVVETHHGSLKVESKVGTGTTFTMVLPPSKTPAGPTVVDLSPSRPPKGTTILLVDDDDTVRSTMAKLLRKFDCKVYVAEHGLQAIEVFEQHRDEVEVVLLDLDMPKMNGRDAGRILRSLDPKLSIVISSGYSSDLAQVKLPGTGFTGFLEKPYGYQELFAELKRGAANS